MKFRFPFFNFFRKKEAKEETLSPTSPAPITNTNDGSDGKYPFKNLILKGGGVRGISYLGALSVLYDKEIISQIERVAGSSAGAITALIIALNFDKETTVDIANSLDFKKVPQTPSFFATRDANDPEHFEEEAMPRGLVNTFANIGTTVNEVKYLFNTLGMHTSEYIYNWFDDQVAKLVGKRGGTFKEFVEAGGKDLYITVTNISSNTSHVCCAETTPDLEVAEAVRTSMSIPIFFESIVFENIYFKGYFGDGGVMNNYPINLFDKGLEPNPETLGLFIYATPSEQRVPENYGLKNIIGDLIASLLEAQDWQFARQKEDVVRSIQISSLGISATDFDIEKGDEKHTKLVNEGTRATNAFLKAYEANEIETLMIPANVPQMGGYF